VSQQQLPDKGINIMLRLVSVFWMFLVVVATQVVAEETVEVFVDKKSEEILTVINEGRAGYEADPDALQGQMAPVLDELVDFQILSRGVMGKHYKAANDDQKATFQQTLRDYLIEVYTKALVTFESKSIEILPLKKPATDKATISMEVTTLDDATFLLAYSMAKTESIWQVRNIIVDGINMGLTYRNQFDSMMISNSNDMDAVIANWTAEADDDEFTK
jgi:phospholipid transport system substrate-binding protein